MNSRRQSVGEHCWNMMVMATYLYGRYEDEENRLSDADLLKLYQAILFHDVCEGRRGLSDVSFWCKAKHPEVKAALKKAELRWENEHAISLFTKGGGDLVVEKMKLLDGLELMWTLVCQARLGNSLLVEASWPVTEQRIKEKVKLATERALVRKFRAEVVQCGVFLPPEEKW